MNTFEIPTAIGEAIIESSMRAVRQFGAAHEQGEKMARVVLDHGRVTREEGQKAAQRWAEMARENQKQVQTLVHNTVRLSLDSFRTAQQQTIDELTKQVERLTRQVEALSKTAKV